MPRWWRTKKEAVVELCSSAMVDVAMSSSSVSEESERVNASSRES
jgi:hypothetical protein